MKQLEMITYMESPAESVKKSSRFRYTRMGLVLLVINNKT